MKNFDDKISHFRDLLDLNLKKIYRDGPQSLVDTINYVLSGVGKRFRPILTMIVADINNVPMSEVLNPSISIEMLHNFTLIHDDIMDKDILRHGKATVHNKWNDICYIHICFGSIVCIFQSNSSVFNHNFIFSHYIA